MSESSLTQVSAGELEALDLARWHSTEDARQAAHDIAQQRLYRRSAAAALEGCIYRAEIGEANTLGSRLITEVAKVDGWVHTCLTLDEEYAGLETADDPCDRAYQAAYQLIQGRCDNLKAA